MPTTSGQEVLKVAPEVIDRQLGHLIGTSAFRAYDKNTQMLDERREFLSQWHRALVERGLKVSSVEGDIDQ